MTPRNIVILLLGTVLFVLLSSPSSEEELITGISQLWSRGEWLTHYSKQTESMREWITFQCKDIGIEIESVNYYCCNNDNLHKKDFSKTLSTSDNTIYFVIATYCLIFILSYVVRLMLQMYKSPTFKMNKIIAIVKDDVRDLLLLNNSQKNKKVRNAKPYVERKTFAASLLEDYHSIEYLRQQGVPQVNVSVSYPDNQNPMLPLKLQQRLDSMSPRDFLSYVLNDLTLEERESLMVDERQRRKSFLVRWPHHDGLSGVKMAQAGFYFLNDRDRVQCVFCRGCLHRWDSDDIPMVEHARSFNFCRFVKGLECGNKEYRSNMLTHDDMRNITKFGNVTYSETRSQNSENEGADGGAMGISTYRAANVQYAPEPSRMRTFARWPPSSPVSAQKLCSAGFFFTGFDDMVRCFYCAGGLKNWSSIDDPWQEHAKWFPGCAYLLHKKGQHYVDEIRAKTPANKKCVQETKLEKLEEAKKIKHENEQEHMLHLCKLLGHSSNIISKAIEINHKPFEKVGDMLDMIYDLEDGKALKLQATGQPIPEMNSVCPQEDIQRHRSPVTQCLQTDGAGNQQRKHKYDLGCKNCEKRTDSFVPATHIGLPCGHLIYCDSCNTEESRKTRNSQQRITCPHYGCSTILNATMKFYFA